MVERILLTGVAGFVGSHMLDFILKSHEEVYVYGVDNLQNGKIENIKEFLNNKRFLFKILDVSNINNFLRYKISIILHFAYIIRFDRKSYLKNLQNTYRILEIARKYDAQKLIFLSSTKVYGLCYKNLEIYEDFNRCPSDLYSLSKIISEKAIVEFCKKYGIDYVILRPTRIYGPRDWQKTFYIIFLLQKFGLRIDFDGSEKLVLNLAYVKNLVKLIDKIIFTKKIKNEIFNVNDGYFTLKEVLDMGFRIMDNKAKVSFKIPKTFFNLYTFVTRSFTHARLGLKYSIKKIKKIVDKKYPYFNLYEGLKETIRYYGLI